MVEVFFGACGTDFSLLGLRVEPTSLRNREFMDDIQRGAFLAVAWEGGARKQAGGKRRGEARRARGGVSEQQQASARGASSAVLGLQVRSGTARGSQAHSGRQACSNRM